MAFTRKYDTCSESSEENNLAEELTKTYRELLTEWKESCMKEGKQKKTMSDLLIEKENLGSTIARMEEEVTLLKSKLDNMTKFVLMFNNGTNMLDEILKIGEKKAIGFDYSYMNKRINIPTKKFVSPENKT